MFDVVRHLGARQLMLDEAVPLGFALVLAELFYKFHSFTLETIAFLATWYVLSGLWSLSRRWVIRQRLGPDDLR